jgi:hypothetical protein
MADFDLALDNLSGEHIALETIVVGLCLELKAAGLGRLVEGALTYADAVMETGAIKLGSDARPAHMRKALQTVEAFRKATMGNHGNPKQDV